MTGVGAERVEDLVARRRTRSVVCAVSALLTLTVVVPVAPAAAATKLSWAAETVVPTTASTPTSSSLVDRTEADTSFCPLVAPKTDIVDIKAGTCSGPTQLVLRAPAATLFTTGQVLTASSTGSTSAYLASPVQPAGLTGSCWTSPWRSTLTIGALTRDVDNTVTSFEADYVLECGSPAFWTARSTGSIRWNSTTGYSIVGINPAAYVAPPALPMDHSESVALPITVRGDGVLHVTGVELDARSNVTSLSGETCTGVDLSAATPCVVTVQISPTQLTSAATATAYVDLTLDSGTVVHVSRSFPLRNPLVAPVTLPYPTADGMSIGWTGDAIPGDTVTVLRRPTGATDWATLATGQPFPVSQQDTPRFDDTTAVPGTAYDYATQRVSSGSVVYTSPIDVVSVTVPVTLPTPTTRTRIAGHDSVTTGLPRYVAADSDAGQTVAVETRNNNTTIRMGAGGASDLPVASVDVGRIPGSGSYSPSSRFSWSAVLDSTVCGAAAADRLVVRSVLYAHDGTMRALDASMRLSCLVYPRDVEIRFHTGGGLAVPYPSPMSLSALADVSAVSDPVTATITNPGPDSVTVGVPTVSGSGAGDWTIAPCPAVTLAAGESCAVPVTFHGAAVPSTSTATLAVPVSVGALDLSDLTVPLSGRTTSIATAPTSVMAQLAPQRVIVTWSPPADDGGRPVTSYVVERRVSPDGAWVSVGTPAALTARNVFADESAPSGDLAYRVTASNAVGLSRASDPVTPVPEMDPTVVIGTSAERRSGSPWGVHLAMPFSSDATVPLQSDGHEHESPSATPDGRTVVFSRAATAGAGQFDFDLYRLSLTPGSTDVRLTSTAGLEVDAETSPDMTRLAYTHLTVGSSAVVSQVCLVAYAGGTPICGLTGFAHPSWLTTTTLVVGDDRTATGRLMEVAVTATGFGVPVNLTAPTAAPVPMAGATDPAVSPNGTSVAFVDGQGDPALYYSACDCTTAPMYPGIAHSALWATPQWATSDMAVWDPFTLYDGSQLGAMNANGVSFDAAEVSRIPVSDRVAPVLGAISANYVKPTNEVVVKVSDAGSPKGGVTLRCAIDAGPSSPCTTGYTPSGVAAGHHALHVSARDVSGNTADASYPLTVDATAPSVPTIALAGYTLAASATATFRSTDSLSPVLYDVRWRTWPPGQTAPNGWAGMAASVTSTNKAFSLAAGRTCVQVRARDLAGNVGVWGVETCSTRAIDDRALRRLDRGWIQVTGSAYVGRTATQATKIGLRLVSLTGLSASKFVIVATACPTCGTVGIYHGDVRVGTINLRSSRTTLSKVFVLHASTYRYSQLEIRTTSRGLVRIDAVIPVR